MGESTAGPSRSSDNANYHRIRPTPDGLRSLHRYALKGRDPRLPQIYRYAGQHPLRPTQLSCETEENTYVYFIDSTSEGKKRAYELGKAMEIPYGRLSTMNQKCPGLPLSP